MTAMRAFLDVETSASGQRWEARLGPRQENQALMMAQAHGVPDVIARILAARGVLAEDCERFLNPSIRDLLPDPMSLTDMEPLAARIVKAVRNTERVAIFGDYDVDGACSSALLRRFFGHYGIDAEIYIPDRIFEGYGPNPDAMRQLASRASLIITVDCGTNSAAALAAAREAGADVLVIDHHQVGGALPEGVPVVNPNREDDLSGQGHLCAAGVVFLVLVEAARRLRDLGGPDLLKLVDLAGLATVCDVVPLTGVNRAFVVKGLLAARQQGNAGLAALAKVSRIGEPLNSFHFGFLIGPRINAGGRIGDAALGARLLCTDDATEADAIAATLDRLNAERQAMEQAMLTEAKAEADAELARGNGPAIIVTASDHYHAGIVGLIASRLKDHAKRPAFAIHFNPNGQGAGSGRSIAGFDLGKLVRSAVERGLLVKGGGHAMAAGITIEREKLGALRAFFEEEAASQVGQLMEAETLLIDAAVSADGANMALISEMERAGPYGQGHSQPVLVLPRHRIADVRAMGNGHLRVTLQAATGAKLNGVAWRSAETPLGRFLMENNRGLVHVAGTLAANFWNGSASAQLRILDAAKAG